MTLLTMTMEQWGIGIAFTLVHCIAILQVLEALRAALPDDLTLTIRGDETLEQMTRSRV